MPAVHVFDEFFNHLVTGEHGNMNSGQTYKVRLSNVTPVKDTMVSLTSPTTITAVTGGSYADQTITLTWAETGSGTGIWQLGDASSDVTFTPVSTAYSDFRYAYLYNDTTTTPDDALIAVLDYGSTVTGLTGDFVVNAGSTGWVQFTTPTWA
jgi:hypothetical protein